MVEMDSVVLEDNIRYLVLSNVVMDNSEYYLLSNIDDDKDIKIGKKIIEDGQKYFVSILDEEEFKRVLLLFNSKLNN